MLKIKKSIVGIIILLVMTMSVGIVFATANSNQGNLSVLESGEVLDEVGLFVGDQVRIDGTVEGTTFATGSEIRINGTINGDLFVSGQDIYIDGTVKGNIYGAGMNVTLGGKAEKEVFLAGQNLSIRDTSSARDIFMGGNIIRYSGNTERNFYAGGTTVSVDGIVGQNANIEAENLNIQENAKITGDLSYRSQKEADIASNASITGKTEWEQINTEVSTRTVSSTVKSKLFGIASALLIWFLIAVWRPDFWNRTADSIRHKPLKAFGVGSLALIVTPIVAILVMITVIGIPLGFILGAVYGIAIYITKIIVAVCIGRWIAERLNLKEIHRGVWLVLAGLVILAILTIPQIPVLDVIVGFVIVILGLGSLILSNYKVEGK